MRQDFFVEHNLFARLRVRRTEGDPTSNADIVEHLQQPFNFRPGERELKAGSRLLEMSGFVQHGPDVFPVLLPLGGERFFQQPLVFVVLGGPGRFGEAMMRRGNQGIELEDIEQQALFRLADFKNQFIPSGPDEFHASSRSMVACRLYFWSWWT